MIPSIDTSAFSKSHILIIGDVMLDRYLWGDVKRISPEAPVPVFHIRRRSEVPGGAGNVVSNLMGLGCQVSLIGVRGRDRAGERLIELMSNNFFHDLTIALEDLPTVTKTRLVSGGQQLLRLDDEEIKPLEPAQCRQVLAHIEEGLDRLHAIVLSDYGKGVLQSTGLAQEIISLAAKSSIPVFVDPKGADWGRYKGATCITPNTLELEKVYKDSINDVGQLTTAMQAVLDAYRLQWLLVTRGPQGMCLLGRDQAPLHIASKAREVYDVSGAGDTVISMLTLAVAAGYSFPEAAAMANLAAGIVVGKLGTQPVTLFELNAAARIASQAHQSYNNSKIATVAAATLQLQAWRANGERIVFTNGCFDLLHPGHIHLLNQCKQLGDRLIIGLNADVSVRRLKGESRPILNEQDRASILGALNCVDLVVLFETDTPESLIRELKPDILVKGSDYRLEEVVGRDVVLSYGGIVKTVQLLEGYSTTNISKMIMNARN